MRRKSVLPGAVERADEILKAIRCETDRCGVDKEGRVCVLFIGFARPGQVLFVPCSRFNFHECVEANTPTSLWIPAVALFLLAYLRNVVSGLLTMLPYLAQFETANAATKDLAGASA